VNKVVQLFDDSDIIGDCRGGNYGDYQQSAMYIPVSGLYYQQDPQVCMYA